MSTLAKHQIVALFVAGIFGLFNIGIPVVIASCPMAEYGPAPMCAECAGEIGSNAERLTSLEDTSCCATVIVADGNTNEFLQSRAALSHVESVDIISVLPSMVETSKGYSSLITLDNHSPSPPRFEDIPIFNSSLLI